MSNRESHHESQMVENIFRQRCEQFLVERVSNTGQQCLKAIQIFDVFPIQFGE